MNNSIDPDATKYMVKAKISADGVVDKPDVVGAIFGQTEGLLGDDLDLRDLQKSGRIGRIEVEIASKGGKSEGIVHMSSSLDQVESAILAATLETIDRVGPCKASVKVIGIEDVRITKRERIVERARELLEDLVEQARGTGANLATNVRQSVQIEEITTFGPERCPAGPNVKNSEAIIIVEGRSDVLNLLRAGIKNAVAVEGTNIPKSVQELSRERVTTAFIDGDRGGELILRELFQTSEIDFVARAPRAHEVEELSAKQLVKCLRNKVPGDQYMEMNNLRFEEIELSEDAEKTIKGEQTRDYNDEEPEEGYRPRRDRRGRRDEERGNRFNSEVAERFKKRRYRDEETISEQTVDTVPAKHRFAEEEPVHRKPVEVTAKVEGPKEESVVEGAPAVEGPKEEPRREIRPNKRNTRASKGPSSKILSEEQEKIRDILHGIIGTHNAVLLNADMEEIFKVEVRRLADFLGETDISEDIAAVVSDGVVGQNLINVASRKGIATLVGKKKGKITKLPSEMTVWVKDDLD